MCPWVYGHPLGCEQPTNSHIPRDRCSLFLENLELPRSFHHWPTPQLSSHTRIITLSSPCSQEEAQGADLFNDQVTIAWPLWPWEHGRGGSYLSMWLLNPRCELFVQWITRRSTMNKMGKYQISKLWFHRCPKVTRRSAWAIILQGKVKVPGLRGNGSSINHNLSILDSFYFYSHILIINNNGFHRDITIYIYNKFYCIYVLLPYLTALHFCWIPPSQLTPSVFIECFSFILFSLFWVTHTVLKNDKIINF